MEINRVYLLYIIVALSSLAIVLTLLLRPTTRSTPATFHVSQIDGLDSRTCDQARNASTPRASVNQGNACLRSGDILLIGPGVYDELLLGQTSSNLTCHSGDAAVQPGCAPIPNGLSTTQKTTLRASKDTVLSPAGRQLPGGGYAITLHDQARYIHIEGFTIVRHSSAGSVGGIYMGNVQHVTLRGNTLDDGQIKGGISASHIEVVGNHLFNTGVRDCPKGVKPTPAQCKHGMYLCGTDTVISDNYVHDTSYYGIQVSCEQGGIARIRIERNRVENSPVVGIRCAGTDCIVGANLLLNNGIGITLGGSGTASNNTIHGYFKAPWDQDPWGIYGTLTKYTITNNIITAQKNASSMISNDLKPPDANYVHHNMGELNGNSGVTLVAPGADIYANIDAKDYTLKSDSPARGAGANTPVLSGIHNVAYPSPPDLGAYSSASVPTPPVDTAPPTIAITNPPPNEQVFGTSLPLIANASDNIAVLGVVFSIDGVKVGDEITTAPYKVIWNTTTVGNGSHTLIATARDAAGLTAIDSRPLRVENPVAPAAVILKCAGRIDGVNLAFACTRN